MGGTGLAITRHVPPSSFSAEGVGNGKMMGSSLISDRAGSSMEPINGVSPESNMSTTSFVTSGLWHLALLGQGQAARTSQ